MMKLCKPFTPALSRATKNGLSLNPFRNPKVSRKDVRSDGDLRIFMINNHTRDENDGNVTDDHFPETFGKSCGRITSRATSFGCCTFKMNQLYETGAGEVETDRATTWKPWRESVAWMSANMKPYILLRGSIRRDGVMCRGDVPSRTAGCQIGTPRFRPILKNRLGFPLGRPERNVP